MAPEIYHLSLASDWDDALRADEYRMSTLGRTLDEVGFIHFAHAGAQLAGVAERYYPDVTEPLVLLTIDADQLAVVDEPPAPGSPDRYPHLYGPLPLTAVVAVTPMVRDERGVLGPLP